nr:LysR family transcriptional regulator [uncultured Endozoicomonas sp.]
MDLNQLLVLNLILEQKNITSVARSLGISQPAVSRILSALRRHFADDLLVRDKQKYTLTPLALQIQPKLDRFIACVEDISKNEGFDPSTYIGEFKIALLSTISPQASMRLVNRIRTEAPNVTLNICEWDKSSLENIQQLKLDIGVGHANQAYASLRQRLLSHYFPSFAVFNDHPLAKSPTVTLDELFSYPHIKYVIPGFDRTVETERTYLNYQGRRQVVLETENASIATYTFLNARSLVINKAKYIPALLEYKDQITFLTLSDMTKIPAGMELQIIWHTRNQAMPAHQWLRELVYEEIYDLT